MLRLTFTLSLVFLLMAMATACSSGGGPLTPEGPIGTASQSQLPVYVNTSGDEIVSATGALGVYQVSLNTESMTIDLVPTRMSSFVPSEYEVDLTLALSATFCQDCFIATGLAINSDGNVLLEVGLKHPFAPVTSLPAPRPQRPDLHIFDVQGIVVIEGTQSFPRSDITLNPRFVANADGYTSVFDAVIDSLGGDYTTSANCHPFKILSMGDYPTSNAEIGNYDALSLNGYPNPSGILNPTGFNVLKCGQGWSPSTGNDYMHTTYELKPDGASMNFFFVVTCSYGQSAKGMGSDLQRRDNPVYLLPAFSKPEAWWVDVDVENNELADNDDQSTAEVVVRVADWQDAWGGNTPNPNFDPVIDQALPRNTLLHASDINIVEIDVPGLNSPTDDSSAVVPSGVATYNNPRTFRITVNNDEFASVIPNPNDIPQFWGLISVKDDLEETSNPTGGIDHNLDILSSFFAISDYTTYQVFGISIFPPNDAPVPNIVCTDPGGTPPYIINSGYLIDFTGTGSFDTDGRIIKGEWDFDFDPVSGIFSSPTDPNYFVQECPVLPCDPDFLDPPPWKMNNLFDVDASKFVALRVTDDSLGQTQSTTWVEVIIHANQPPVPDLGVAFYETLFTAAPYTFYDGECVTLLPGPLTDDDGNITTYQYDFSYDGALFIVDDANTTGAPVLSPVQVQGSVDMATRVIDNGIPNLNAVDFKTITVLGPAVDPPVQVSDPTASGVELINSGYHAVAASSTHVVCAWTQDGNLKDIYYSVTADGGLTWSAPAVINTTTTGSQQAVSLAVDSTANVFYASFKDNSAGSTQISYAISDVAAAGWQVLNQGLLPSFGSNPEDPCIAINPTTDQIYIAYQTTVGSDKVIALRTSTDGGLTWNTPLSGINSDNTNDRTDPSIAFDATNNRVGVSWDDYRNSTDFQIYFNWSDLTGTAFQVSDVQVYPTTEGQNDPSLINSGGTWMLTFDDLEGTTDIHFTSSADGITWGAPVDCTDNESGVHNESSLTIDGAGVLYMATRDSRETGVATQADIYIFKSTDSGATWVRGVRANDRVGTENTYSPNVMGLPGLTGGFIVMFESPDNAVYCGKSNAY